MLLSLKLPIYLCVFSLICSRPCLIEAQEASVPIKNDLNETKHLPMMGESGINYGNMEISEPGFDIDDEDIQRLKIWPRGIIPYFIDDFSFDKVLRDKVRAFLEHTNTVSGVRFSELSQPPDDDSRWVFFINRRGVLPCADLDIRKFTNTGAQKVVIGYDCMESGDLAEIVLALVGVPPQHNAPDRDRYIEVQTNNILPGKEHLFEKFGDTEWLFHDVEYDFISAGHYGYHKYTANGRATLKPLEVVDVRTGEVTSYSFNDIWKIRMLYNFISKNGQNSSDNTAACSKLFKPGAKFRQFIPNEDDEDEVKPRPKPSKFTGIQEDKLPKPDDDYENDNEKKENSYKNMHSGNDDGGENNNRSENNNTSEKQAEGPVKLRRPRPTKKISDKLYLTDFQTEEK